MNPKLSLYNTKYHPKTAFTNLRKQLGIDLPDWMSESTLDDTVRTPTYPFSELLGSALGRMSQQMSHLCRLVEVEGAQAKWLNFSTHYCADAQFPHNFQPFCSKLGKLDANVFFRRQTDPFILLLLQKKLVALI